MGLTLTLLSDMSQMLHTQVLAVYRVVLFAFLCYPIYSQSGLASSQAQDLIVAATKVDQALGLGLQGEPFSKLRVRVRVTR